MGTGGALGLLTTLSMLYRAHPTRGCSSFSLPFWKGLAPQQDSALGQDTEEITTGASLNMTSPCLRSPTPNTQTASAAPEVCSRPLHPLNKHLLCTRLWGDMGDEAQSLPAQSFQSSAGETKQQRL